MQEKNSVVLYERNPDANRLPRGALAVTYFMSTYWTWYAVDFIPSVNNSPLEYIHVSPWVGVGGCTLSYAVTFAACLYCKQMVSRVVLQKDSAKPVHVYLHSLPFMMASSKPVQYAYGDASLDYNSDDVQKLMTALDTRQDYNSQTTSVAGHLPLKTQDRKFPLGIYLTSTGDVKDKEVFLETLLFAPFDKSEGGKQEKPTTGHTKERQRFKGRLAAKKRRR
jgi:hypothetical protein